MRFVDELPVRAEPRDTAKLRAHMIGDHEMPVETLDQADERDWKIWHEAEHRTRHPSRDQAMHSGHLRHIHEKYIPK